MKKMLLAGALAGSLLLLGACGSDDADPTSDDTKAPVDTSLTKAELIKQGDAICKAGSERLDAASKDFPEEPTEKQVTDFVSSTMVPDLKRQSTELHALKPAEADKAGYEGVLDALDAGIEVVEKDPIKVTGDAFSDANKKAVAFGFKVCSQD